MSDLEGDVRNAQKSLLFGAQRELIPAAYQVSQATRADFGPHRLLDFRGGEYVSVDLEEHARRNPRHFFTNLQRWLRITHAVSFSHEQGALADEENADLVARAAAARTGLPSPRHEDVARLRLSPAQAEAHFIGGGANTGMTVRIAIAAAIVERLRYAGVDRGMAMAIVERGDAISQEMAKGLSDDQLNELLVALQVPPDESDDLPAYLGLRDKTVSGRPITIEPDHLHWDEGDLQFRLSQDMREFHTPLVGVPVPELIRRQAQGAAIGELFQPIGAIPSPSGASQVIGCPAMRARKLDSSPPTTVFRDQEQEINKYLKVYVDQHFPEPPGGTLLRPSPERDKGPGSAPVIR